MIKILYGLENKMMSEVLSTLMLDNEFNKLVYYKFEKGDILKLPDLEEPFTQLKEQMFKNRRPMKNLTEDDVCVFIYLDDDRNRVRSKKIKTVWIKIGFIVHENCSKTQNGVREVSMIHRIIEIMESTQFNSAIGKCKCEKPGKLYGLPYQWNGYEISIRLDGWI